MTEIDFLKEALNTKRLTNYGTKGGGCVNEGRSYMTDDGPVYVKHNKHEGAKEMFDGEYESLVKIYATNTVRVPKPIKVLQSPDGGGFLVTEHLDIRHGLSKFEAELGRCLGNLHNFNASLLREQEKMDGFIGQKRDDFVVEPVKQFGFHIKTSATPGFSTDNAWHDDWATFYGQQKLLPLVNRINELTPCQELNEYWSQLSRKLPSFFTDCQPIVPSLLHGDMWNGNVAETDSEPVFFDPMSFYGHAEYEFGIAEMFGGFSSAFYDAYHKLCPKSKGFSRRNKLYQLFHHLNHWFIFGESYKGSSLSLMKRLCK